MDDIDEKDERQMDVADDDGVKKGFTRRKFLAGAAVGAAVVGVGSRGFLGVPAALAESAQSSKLPSKWQRTVDVVVVGTGCGLAAAIEAKNAGASALIVEKADHVGGLYMTAGGSFTMGGNNVVQQAAGVVDNDEQWFEDEMYTSQYRAQPEIVRTLVANGADTVKWFQDLGIKYAPLSAGVLRPPIWRGITALQNPGVYPGGSGTPNTGISFTWVMWKKVQKQGTPILLNTRMLKMYRDRNGVVVGIQARGPKGLMNIRARKGVVVAAGTWTDNQTMMQQWDPRTVGPDCYGDGGTPIDGTLYIDSAGDGHRACADIGAGLADMSFTSYLYTFFGGRSYWGWGHDPIDWTTNTNYAAGKGLTQSAATFQSTICVANNGKRYVNESTRFDAIPAGRGSYSENPEMTWTTSYLALPQPRNVWMIADSTTAATLGWPISTMQNPDPKSGIMLDPTCLAIDDTIAGLAAKMGVNAANLQATITRYNGFVDSGTDADFGKPSPKGKILTGPFYGAKLSLIRHTQRNGLRVNTKMQVIEAEQGDAAPQSIDQLTTIPHLYVAGESGDIVGYRRGHNTLAHYVTAARLCGMNAAKNVPAVK